MCWSVWACGVWWPRERRRVCAAVSPARGVPRGWGCVSTCVSGCLRQSFPGGLGRVTFTACSNLRCSRARYQPRLLCGVDSAFLGAASVWACVACRVGVSACSFRARPCLGGWRGGVAAACRGWWPVCGGSLPPVGVFVAGGGASACSCVGGPVSLARARVAVGPVVCRARPAPEWAWSGDAPSPSPCFVLLGAPLPGLGARAAAG